MSVAWEPSTHRNTLILYRRRIGIGRYVYKLASFFRRTDQDGASYMTPLSMEMYENSGLVFDQVEFIEMQTQPHASKDGDTLLNGADYFTQMSLGAG